MKVLPARPLPHTLTGVADTATPINHLHRSVRWQYLFPSLLIIALLSLTPELTDASLTSIDFTRLACTTLLVWGTICALLWRGLPYHPHARFGPANVVTLYRSAGVALLAGCIPVASLLTESGFWFLSLAAVCLLALDGFDGYLARRSGLASDFGARFDMEIDALLTLVMSLLLWQSGEAGLWILSLGLIRYAFVAASTIIPALGKALFPSFRRKLICVIQLGTLCAMLSPLLEPPLSSTAGALACLLLMMSFARDVHWLLSKPS